VEEMLYMQQVLSGGGVGNGLGWVQAALVLCFFMVVLWKPERIRAASLFRLACLMLALSMLLPSVLSIGIGFWNAAFSFGSGSNWLRGMNRGPSGIMALVWMFTSAARPMMVGLSVIFGLFSLMTPSPRSSASAPTKHPLE